MMDQVSDPLLAVRSYVRAGLVVSLTLLFGVGGWAYTAEIAGAVVAGGQVIAETNVKKVAHVTGGNVGEIFVTDGTLVKQGDLLIKLDETVPKANLGIVTANLRETTVRLARLLAERDDASLIGFPPEVEAWRSDPEGARLLDSETRLFDLRRKSRLGQQSQLRERVGQIKEEIEGLTIQAAAKKREVEVMTKELEATRSLWAKNLIPINRVTVIERDAIRTEGEAGRLISSIAQSKGKISETQMQILQVDQEFRSEVARELRDVQAKVVELSERRIAAEDQLNRVEIRAPQDGYVHQLQVFSKGAVITPGTAIVSIVPSSDKLAIEAKVPVHQIDQVHVGAKATFRLTSLNQRTTPELYGEVYRVSATAETEERTGATFYTVRVTLPENEVKRLGTDVKLIPGMPAEVFIKTSDRTVLSYLVKPMSDQITRAFRER